MTLKLSSETRSHSEVKGSWSAAVPIGNQYVSLASVKVGHLNSYLQLHVAHIFLHDKRNSIVHLWYTIVSDGSIPSLLHVVSWCLKGYKKWSKQGTLGTSWCICTELPFYLALLSQSEWLHRWWGGARNSGKPLLGTVENYSDSFHISGVIIGLCK